MGLRIVAFVEGSYHRAGGLGLTGAPAICQALAARGHSVTLGVGGAMPGVSPLEEPLDAGDIGQRLRIVSCAALGKWAFSPLLASKVLPEVRETDFVFLHSVYSYPVLLGYVMSKCVSKPFGIWPHGVLAPVQRRTGAKKKWLYDRVVARRMLDEASVLFYSAKGERDEAAGLGLKPQSVVVPHGIRVAEYGTAVERGKFRASRLQGHAGPLALYVGRLNAKKGLHLLIEAFARVSRNHSESRLAIVGGGDPLRFEREVRSWVAEHNLQDRVVVTGLVTELEKRQALADADVFVLASEAENFGFAMFEAMASGIPVVVSDALNFADEVRKSEAGLVCERRPEAFAAAISQLFGDASLRKQMGGRGIDLARQYSWERAGERMERTIEAILSGRPLPSELTMM